MDDDLDVMKQLGRKFAADKVEARGGVPNYGEDSAFGPTYAEQSAMGIRPRGDMDVAEGHPAIRVDRKEGAGPYVAKGLAANPEATVDQLKAAYDADPSSDPTRQPVFRRDTPEDQARVAQEQAPQTDTQRQLAAMFMAPHVAGPTPGGPSTGMDAAARASGNGVPVSPQEQGYKDEQLRINENRGALARSEAKAITEQSNQTEAAELERRQAIVHAANRFAAEADRDLTEDRQRYEKLMHESTVDPDRFWKTHWAGPVGGRVLAAISMGFLGFGSGAAGVKAASDMIDSSIKEDIDAQVSTHNHQLALAKQFGINTADRIHNNENKLKTLEFQRTAGLEAAARQAKAMAASAEGKDKQLYYQGLAAALGEKAEAEKRKRQEETLQKWQQRMDAAASAAHAAAEEQRKWERNFGGQVTLEMLKASAGADKQASIMAARNDLRGADAISKKAEEVTPVVAHMNDIISLAPAMNKMSLPQRAMLTKLADPVWVGENPNLAEMMRQHLPDGGQEAAQALSGFTAFRASADGGKTVTAVEARLGVAKGGLQKLLSAVIAGNASPADIKKVEQARDMLKTGTLALGSENAQKIYGERSKAAAGNAHKGVGFDSGR